MRRGEGIGRLLERVLEVPAGVSEQDRESAGEREREKERHRDPSSDGAKVL